MRQPAIPILAMAAISVLLLGAVACSDTDSDDVSSAVSDAQSQQVEVCDKLRDLDAAVGEVASLNATSTVDDAKEAKSDVKDAVEEVAKARGNAAEAQLTALTTASDAMSSTVDSLSGSQTLGEASATLAAQSRAITTALTGLKAEQNCS